MAGAQWEEHPARMIPGKGWLQPSPGEHAWWGAESNPS